MTSLAVQPETFIDDIRRISRDVARVHADSVDRESRFPTEAIDALREVGALSAWVPASLGGGGLGLAEMTAACRELGRGCSATGMIFAMHQLQIANIFRHCDLDGAFGEYLRRVVREQRLVASITSEVGTGGDMSRSIAALSPAGEERFSFEKQAPTISYGGHCDDLLTSVRRSPDADAHDQVMVLHARSESEMTPTGVWDTLGMRGTCSPGFQVKATIGEDQILTEPFGQMMAETIVPISHILWVNVWFGIASEAFDRSHAFVRAAARKKPGEPVPAARGLSATSLEMRLLRAEIDRASADFEAWDATADREALNALSNGLRFNSLKLVVSERVPGICIDALKTIGIMAYKNDSPFSIGRLLRDSLSAQLMIANERIHGVNANLLSLTKEL